MSVDSSDYKYGHQRQDWATPVLGQGGAECEVSVSMWAQCVKFADTSFRIDSLSECLMCLWNNQSDFQLGNGYEQWLSVTAGYLCLTISCSWWSMASLHSSVSWHLLLKPSASCIGSCCTCDDYHDHDYWFITVTSNSFCCNCIVTTAEYMHFKVQTYAEQCTKSNRKTCIIFISVSQ